jgi:hypothetical protein
MKFDFGGPNFLFKIDLRFIIKQRQVIIIEEFVIICLFRIVLN